MDLIFASDPYVRFGAVVAASAAALTALLVLQILVLRARRVRAERQRATFLERWRPLLHEAIAGGGVRWPALRKRDHETLLRFWNEMHESVRGEAKAALSTVAVELGLHRGAQRMLGERRVARRLLGIVTLGNLRDPAFWDALAPALDDAHAPVSLAAAAARVRINPRRAVPDLMPRFASRADWPVSRVLGMLRQSDPAVVTAAIRRHLPDADDAAALRLLALSAAADAAALQGEMVARLRRSRNPQLWAAVLRQIRDPVHLGLVRQCCAHKVWFVRVQAAITLGRLGGPEDVGRLIALLGDEAWWVRYRAAESLLALPFLTPAELEEQLVAAAVGPEARAVLAEAAAREAG